MLEKYSYYEFEVFQQFDDNHKYSYYYEIYTDDPDYNNWLRTNVLLESSRWYDTEKEARKAAREHIDAIESGEPYGETQ